MHSPGVVLGTSGATQVEERLVGSAHLEAKWAETHREAEASL